MFSPRFFLFFVMADQFDKSKSYTATPNPTQPNKAQKPGAHDLNPKGSKYAKDYGKTSSNLIK